MIWVSIITIVLLLQFEAFGMMVGSARGKFNISAPSTTGDPIFERTFRVHQNTMENLLVILPLIWLCAYLWREDVAAVAGLIFFIGRWIYCRGYLQDPAKRGTGMMVSFVGTLVVLAGSIWGVIASFL